MVLLELLGHACSTPSGREHTCAVPSVVRVLKRLGFQLAIVSGGFQQMADKVKADLGMDYAFANKLEVRDGVLTVANAGDSRAVLCRGGEALPLSEDHKPAQARELARIEAAGGFVTPQGRVNGNLNLSRALGDLKYKGNTAVARAEQMITAEPDVKVVRLEASDEFLLLACDGVWDVMTSQQCVDFVRERIAKGMALEEIVSEIFDACISEDPKTTGGLGGDNMTAIIVRLKQ